MKSAIGALITKFAGVGQVFGISRWVTIPVTTAFLLRIALTRGYRRVERIGSAVGLAERAFTPAMFMSHPEPSSLLTG